MSSNPTAPTKSNPADTAASLPGRVPDGIVLAVWAPPQYLQSSIDRDTLDAPLGWRVAQRAKANAVLEADTITGTRFFRLLACCSISSAAYAGILVSRSAQGVQFTDAVAITFNAKDKALSLGEQPKISGPISKLPSTHVNGMLLKDSDAGVLARYEAGKAEYLLPQGLPKTAPDSPAAIWTATRISYRKSAQDKAGAEIPAAAFVAFLPLGAEELTRLCMDDAALAVVGGKGKTLTTQIELISAVVKAYAADPRHHAARQVRRRGDAPPL